VVSARARSDHGGRLRVSDEAQALAGDTEPELELGAHRDPAHVTPERGEQEVVALVAPVVADLGAEETRADPDADLRTRVLWSHVTGPVAGLAPKIKKDVSEELRRP
jgi:hypothetical protein